MIQQQRREGKQQSVGGLNQIFPSQLVAFIARCDFSPTLSLHHTEEFRNCASSKALESRHSRHSKNLSLDDDKNKNQ